MSTIGWESHRLGGGWIFLRRLGPASIAKFQRYSPPTPWEELTRFIKANRVFMCKLEPGNWSIDPLSFKPLNLEMETRGFKFTNQVNICMSTIFIPLDKGEDDLISNFGADARRKIRRLLQFDHKLSLDDLELFYCLLKSSHREKRLWCPPFSWLKNLKNAFQNNCFTLCVNNECGCMVLVSRRGVALYLHAATLPSAKISNTPYLLIWHALLESKRRGAKVWDFEGIYDPRHGNRLWRNFSIFKSRFNGQTVYFPGDFIQWRIPL